MLVLAREQRRQALWKYKEISIVGVGVQVVEVQMAADRQGILGYVLRRSLRPI